MPEGLVERESLRVLWRVQEDFLAEALQAIDADHGGIDRYLARRIGLGDAARQTLAARLLVVCQQSARQDSVAG